LLFQMILAAPVGDVCLTCADEVHHKVQLLAFWCEQCARLGPSSESA